MRCALTILILITINPIPAYSENTDLSRVKWAPTWDDVLKESEIKMLVFFGEKSMPDYRRKKIENLEEIGRITDFNKIEAIMETMEEDANYCECEDQCKEMWGTWLGVVNKKNKGFLINFGWSQTKERAEWSNFYSKAMYDLLIDYEIIKPTVKPIIVNEPHSVRFQMPPKESFVKNPKVITIYRERDINQIYVMVDPQKTPVYIQVDPNVPIVYVAIDPNQIAIRELTPALNVIKESSMELLVQNRWLQNALKVLLTELETAKGLQPISSETSDIRTAPFEVSKSDIPYLVPESRPISETNDIHKLGALLSLQGVAMNMSRNSNRYFIKNCDKQMKRLEINLDETKDSNTAE